MLIKEIPHGSDLYESSKRLRDEVLRKPIGLALSEKDAAGEEHQFHIAAINKASEVVGTVLLKPLTSTHIKLRQMAVSASLQGAGLGRELVHYAHALAAARGFHTVECNARCHARGFYEKLGYAATGEEFKEVGLPTIKMQRHLISVT